MLITIKINIWIGRRRRTAMSSSLYRFSPTNRVKMSSNPPLQSYFYDTASIVKKLSRQTKTKIEFRVENCICREGVTTKLWRRTRDARGLPVSALRVWQHNNESFSSSNAICANLCSGEKFPRLFSALRCRSACQSSEADEVPMKISQTFVPKLITKLLLWREVI